MPYVIIFKAFARDEDAIRYASATVSFVGSYVVVRMDDSTEIAYPAHMVRKVESGTE